MFQLMMKSYDIDRNLELLEYLDRVYRSKAINEVNREREYFHALKKYLTRKEIKTLLNFDHFVFRKRKRDVFEK